MGEMVYETARKQAVEILAVDSAGSSGLSGLIKIARRFGAEVEETSLMPGVSGMIVKENNSSPKIFISSSDSPEIKRFTLAHEIGHLIDRMKIGKDGEYSFRDGKDWRDRSGRRKYDLHEFFADEFAGSILMPAKQFIRSYRDHGPYATASAFGVTVPAVETRLRRLRRHAPLPVELA